MNGLDATEVEIAELETAYANDKVSYLGQSKRANQYDGDLVNKARGIAARLSTLDLGPFATPGDHAKRDQLRNRVGQIVG